MFVLGKRVSRSLRITHFLHDGHSSLPASLTLHPMHLAILIWVDINLCSKMEQPELHRLKAFRENPFFIG